MEFYIKYNNLISESEWISFLENLKIPEPNPNKLKEAIEKAVLNRVPKDKKVGLFFSGGVDSTLIGFILKKHNISFTAYTVGFQDEGTKEPEDITESKKIAKELGFNQKIIFINKDQAKSLFEKTIKVCDTHSVISLGVGGVEVVAAEVALQDGITVIFGGLGSEEIFAGYQRHKQANNVQEECWNGLKKMYERDIIRDFSIAKNMGYSAPTPLLDEQVITQAMAIPDTEKIKVINNIEYKKYVLRVIAKELGLPKKFAFRPKRAAQYGSRLDSALDKIARSLGMGKSEYVSYLTKKLKSPSNL